jgi:RimJ/RimL family protein N-acetyltransferase
MNPVYQLETERLILRVLSPGDAAELWRPLDESREHLARWLDPPAAPMTIDDAARLLRRWRARFDLDEGYVYGIFLRQEGRFIGCAELLAKPWALGYWLHRDFMGHDYAAEVAAALTRVVLGLLGAERLETSCDPEDEASWRIAERVGFRHETTVRAADGREQMVWAMRSDALEGSRAAATRLCASDGIGRTLLDDRGQAPAPLAAWTELVRYLGATRTILAGEASFTVSVRTTLDGHELLTQVVSGALVCFFDEPRLVLRARVAGADAITAREALLRNRVLSAGALCLDHDELCLRHAMSFADPAEVEQVLHQLAYEAARLRQRCLAAAPRAAPVLTCLAE